MPVFSKLSAMRLATCHPDLQRIMNRAILEYDFSVICGLRNEADQLEAFNKGTSKVKFPHSKHNRSKVGDGVWDLTMSDAVDIAPYPINWNKPERFKDLSRVVLRIAKDMNIQITWGGNWRKLVDLPHYELKS